MSFAKFFLTFCYIGKIKKAPGTFGSVASVILWFFVVGCFASQQISLLWQYSFCAVFLAVIVSCSLFAIPVYAKKIGEIDHKSIVADEVVGQIIALQLPFFLIYGDDNFLPEYLILCFALFRFFDIKKPFIIGYCDRNFKNPFGVMLDDILAGIAAALVAAVLLTLVKL